MRDPGLEEAVRAVGGVSELARQIGISQPSVSNWNRVPAERVLIVEAATGVDRKVLRPDLYREPEHSQPAPDEVAAARAQEYALLATLLARAPDAELLASLARLARRRDAARCRACRARRRPPAKPRSSASSASIFNLFIGLGRGELLPYASYYLTGFLHERPLARLRGDLAPLGIERAEGNNEPEDHAATLCEIMAGLVERPLAGAAGHRSADFREASGALDRALLRRSGAGRSGRSSIVESARSAGCSWKSKRKRSRCRRETAARTRSRRKCDESRQDKTTGRPS